MKSVVDIVLPVYYEEKNVPKVIEDIERYVKTPHRILAVWQDKHDPTVAVLKKLTKRYSTLKLIATEEGVGVVKALRAGYAKTSSPIVVTMMADLSDNPKDIDKMVRRIQAGYDVVSASRYCEGGKRVGGPRVKGLLSFFACWTLSTLFRFPTTDATNAFRTFRLSFLKSVTIESVGGFELPLELTVKAYKMGLRITDIPTTWHERKSGTSKFKLFEWMPHYIRWYILAVTS